MILYSYIWYERREEAENHDSPKYCFESWETIVIYTYLAFNVSFDI